LKKDGKIIVTSPALQFIWSDHDTEQGHFRRYTRRMIKEVASNTKLRIKNIGYFNFFLALPIISIRLLSRIPIFKKFGAFDSDLNFNIAKKNYLNEILKKIFVTEIKLTRYVSYPFGISIYAILKN